MLVDVGSLMVNTVSFDGKWLVHVDKLRFKVPLRTIVDNGHLSNVVYTGCFQAITVMVG